VLSLGAGHQFFETPLQNLSVAGGLAWVDENFDEAEDQDYPAGRWTVDFDRYLLDKFAQLFHFDEGLVSLEDTSDIVVRTRTGLRFLFYKGFNLTAQYNLDWDNAVPPDEDELDHRYLLTFGYEYPR
jgi:putative salt-induced outer membrane protein YdiY